VVGAAVVELMKSSHHHHHVFSFEGSLGEIDALRFLYTIEGWLMHHVVVMVVGVGLMVMLLWRWRWRQATARWRVGGENKGYGESTSMIGERRGDSGASGKSAGGSGSSKVLTTSNGKPPSGRSGGVGGVAVRVL
jgi:hypothetical protein